MSPNFVGHSPIPVVRSASRVRVHESRAVLAGPCRRANPAEFCCLFSGFPYFSLAFVKRVKANAQQKERRTASARICCYCSQPSRAVSAVVRASGLLLLTTMKCCFLSVGPQESVVFTVADHGGERRGRAELLPPHGGFRHFRSFCSEPVPRRDSVVPL